MDYKQFLETKIKKASQSGFDIQESKLNKMLFPFQKFIVKRMLKQGKGAIFADCGLGKTPMQLEWANQIAKHTKKPVLILTPLAVSGQTIEEGTKFHIPVKRYNGTDFPIQISNYEQIENIDCSKFAGVVLDESSILKNFTGVYKRLLIERFANTQFKLCCTATPSPNDINEIGNHSEFLNIMDAPDMRMRWFVRDEGMNNYRLKGHAEAEFYGWIASWASVIRTPADIGFDDKGYNLPDLNIEDVRLNIASYTDGQLFNDSEVNATNFNKTLRMSIKERMSKVIEIIKSKPDESFIIWVKQNDEADYLQKLIPEAVEVRGNEKPETKEKKLLGFAHDEFRILITKSKIAQFGLNYQNCHNQIFASLDFSFESLYQSIRRSYRFGQKEQVNIYLITTDTMSNVIESIRRKQAQFNKLIENSIKYMNTNKYGFTTEYSGEVFETENVKIINGDCVECIDLIPDNSLDFSVYSPPFANLFTYSDNIRDMGNTENEGEFLESYGFLLEKLYKKLKPGRLMAVHTKDIPRYKNSSGYSGMYNFTGAVHNLIEKIGFKYHCKITIWIDPVLEMQRTKTQRLLYKQVTHDSSYSGVGMPEYVTVFRKWEGDEQDWEAVNFLTKQNMDLETWQRVASPVWFDIKRTDVLNNYTDGRASQDEKHICPLQLGVIERLIALYSNVGETIFSPFAGIGSELFQAIKMNRKAIGIELKPEYFEIAKSNLRNAESLKEQYNLFA